jgi:hypothetical protein
MVGGKKKTDTKLSTYHGRGGHKSHPPPAEALVARGRGELVPLNVVASGKSTMLSGKLHMQEFVDSTN